MNWSWVSRIGQLRCFTQTQTTIGLFKILTNVNLSKFDELGALMVIAI
jgi:hypothetical protein